MSGVNVTPSVNASPNPSTGGQLALRWGGKCIWILQIVLIGLALRCGYLQFNKRAHYQAIQESYVNRPFTTLEERGVIITRNGEALVRNKPCWKIGVDPLRAAGTELNEPSVRDARVRNAVGLAAKWFPLRADPTELADAAVAALARGGRYLFLSESDDEAAVDEFTRACEKSWTEWRQQRIPGDFGERCFNVERNWRRLYPHGETALQVLGEARPAGVRLAGLSAGSGQGEGIHGLEAEFNSILGSGTTTRLMRMGGGTRFYEIEEQRDPERLGESLVVTLDLRIQFLLEQLLVEGLEKTSARRVFAIVVDPRSGAILAAANAPHLEPGDYARLFGTAQAELSARTLNLKTFAYEPGSTIKPLIMAEAIEQGVDLTRMAAPAAKSWDLRPLGIRRTIRDTGTTRDHPLTFEESLIHSSNIGMVRLGLELKEQGLRRALLRFGKEKPGKWDDYSTTSIPMGYEIYFTPWELLRAYIAISNGGFWFEPYFVEQVGNTITEEAVQYQQAERFRVMNAATSERLRMLLRRAALEGTGKPLDCERVELAGKTGTAHIWENGAWSATEYHSSFVGFAPWRDPRYLIYVLVERPRGAHYGAQVAGPIARKLIGALMGEDGNAIRGHVERALKSCESE